MATTESAPEIYFDKYIVEKILGEGSYGKVKLAYNKFNKEKVALKIIQKSSIKKQVHITRIKREVSIMRLSAHPNIARLYDVTETEKEIVLAMEYIEGGELFNYIVAQKRLKEKVARDLFRQIVSAMDYCHESCVIHRDLKPENLLLRNGLNIKIIDFGFVNIFDPFEKLETFCGSPYYASPEMIIGKKYTGPEVDIWSMGVILFTLLGGYLPFHDQNTPELFKRITTANYKIPEYFSENAADLIKKILVPDPSKRFTMKDIKSHPWLLEGYEGPPDPHLPDRPLLKDVTQLNEAVLAKMNSYGFGTFTKEMICASSKNAAFAIYYLVKESMERKNIEEANALAAANNNTANTSISVTSVADSNSSIPKEDTQAVQEEKPQVSRERLGVSKQSRSRAVSASIALGKKPSTHSSHDGSNPSIEEHAESSSSDSHHNSSARRTLRDRKASGATDISRKRSSTIDPNSAVSNDPSSPQKVDTVGGLPVPKMRAKAMSHQTAITPKKRAAQNSNNELPWGSSNSRPSNLDNSSSRNVIAAPSSLGASVSGSSTIASIAAAGNANHEPTLLKQASKKNFKDSIAHGFLKLLGKNNGGSGTPANQSANNITRPSTSAPTNDSDLRQIVQTKLMDSSSTSTKSTQAIKDEINRAIDACHIIGTWSSRTIIRCVHSEAEFEIEICLIKKTEMKALVFKRLKGSSYSYQEVCRKLTEIWKL